MDSFITWSNRDQAEAIIWRTIDEQEIKVIADHLVQMGLGSKLAATALRGMARTYRTWEIGVITLPRAAMSIRHYAEHGGFVIPGFTQRKRIAQVERGSVQHADHARRQHV